MQILSVDDNRNNLMMVEIHGKTLGVAVNSYENPKLALAAAYERSFDLVIVDYMMPEMDGLSFIENFRELDPKTPIVMVTAVGDDDDVHYQALQLGATDFLKKPLNGALFKLRVRNLLELKKAQMLLEDRAKLLEVEVTKATEEIRRNEYETLIIVGKTAEFKDPETGEHIKRVSQYARLLAKVYGLPKNLQEVLYHSAALHDIGKVGIPDRILQKEGRLDDDEWELMMSHTLIGYEILKKVPQQIPECRRHHCIHPP